ncbi:hypothetical protein EV644_105336 [Kribbella orskensis]|uniref:Uncharacterized protein n=1 Tax=Kribbella orskensis TaxID=2512216 RepID=A0ABY2BLN6_9ACTN|nr:MULTISPECIES: hypothetical protein [Kribbella]TCN41050.1 hypothetical protein EV642_104336 [Kribbella sp. VKM Ac-2500]TCO24302.1 hypothetical protein EV644_105336 [Kribbella orskensis]
MTKDKKQPALPVVEVDQAFPLMTTDGVSRASTSTGITGDQGPAVSAAIRDVLGWRPRVQDPKAFTAALSASFELSTFEDHVIARYVPRGVAVQADLGGVTGGQASLYLRAKAAHEQITRMLDSLQPLRTDADPQDCEAYRGLVRDSVRRIVLELGREGGPRVPLVDSAFSVLTGYQPATSAAFTQGPVPSKAPTLAAIIGPTTSYGLSGQTPGLVPTAVAEIDPDSVPGQLGALRDRFGLDDDHVNTVDEEKQRTSFWTLVELITDLQRSWDTRRLDFTLGAGNGFLGTDLVQISRLLAAASEQVDELEAVLDSVLVSSAERQTVVLDRTTGLTLDDLVQWLRVFVTEDGPNIIRDSGRDGLVSSFTPTAVELLLTLRNSLVRTVVPCCGPSCASGCHCGSRGKVTCIPLGCCTPLPPGMYSGRVKIAVSTLCGLVERLTAKAIRIGRYAGVVLLDLSVVPYDDLLDTGTGSVASPFVRVEVRGLHLRPTYIPAFIADAGNPANFGSFVLPLQGSASADDDHLSGIFQLAALPEPLRDLLSGAGVGVRGILLAASEVPLAIVDGELGRVVQGPAVTTWPKLRPANVVEDDGGPDDWDEIDPNQRFVPQSPPDPVDPEIVDDCLDDCLDECSDDCQGCDCGCHEYEAGGAGSQGEGSAFQASSAAAGGSGAAGIQAMVADKRVRRRAAKVLPELAASRKHRKRLRSALKGKKLKRLMKAVADAEADRTRNTTTEERLMREAETLDQRITSAQDGVAAAKRDVKQAKRKQNQASRTVKNAKAAKTKALRKVVREEDALAKAQLEARAAATKAREKEQ